MLQLFILKSATDRLNCSGLYFSPEREYLTSSIIASRKHNLKAVPSYLASPPDTRVWKTFLGARSSLSGTLLPKNRLLSLKKATLTPRRDAETHVNGRVRCRAYKGMFSVLGRSSSTEKLYDMEESSMDEIGDFGKLLTSCTLKGLSFLPASYIRSLTVKTLGPRRWRGSCASGDPRYFSWKEFLASSNADVFLFLSSPFQPPARQAASSASRPSASKSTAP